MTVGNVPCVPLLLLLLMVMQWVRREGGREKGQRERHARGRFAERRMQPMTDEGRPRRPAKRSIKAARLCLVLVLFLLMDGVILSLRCCNRFITWKGAAAAAASEILIEQHTHTQSVGWIAEERV